MASTGLTEKAAKEKKLDYKVGKFPFTASGKAVASGDTEGFVKVISDAKTGEILGVHIIGDEATELIAEYGLAMNLEATVEDIHQTIHAHPTLCVRQLHGDGGARRAGGQRAHAGRATPN